MKTSLLSFSPIFGEADKWNLPILKSFLYKPPHHTFDHCGSTNFGN